MYSKLQELIAIYRSRVGDLRAEHHTISQEEEKGGSVGRRRELQDEISQIRDELYKLQKELGLEPQLVSLPLEQYSGGFGFPHDEQASGLTTSVAVRNLDPSISFQPQPCQGRVALNGFDCGSEGVNLGEEPDISQLTGENRDSSDFKNQVRFRDEVPANRRALLGRGNVRMRKQQPEGDYGALSRNYANVKSLKSKSLASDDSAFVASHSYYTPFNPSCRQLVAKPSLSSNRDSKSYFSSQGGARSASACNRRKGAQRLGRQVSSLLDNHTSKSAVSAKSQKSATTGKCRRCKSSGVTNYKEHSARSSNKPRNLPINGGEWGKSAGDISRKSSASVPRSRGSRSKKSAEGRRVRRKHLSKVQTNSQINRDIEGSPPRSGRSIRGDEERVDLRPQDKSSPQFQPRELLTDLEIGVQAQEGNGCTQEYNPYTDNHYTNINLSDYAEIKEEPNEESLRQETEAEEQPNPAAQQTQSSYSHSTLQKKSQFLLEQYRQAKTSRAQAAAGKTTFGQQVQPAAMVRSSIDSVQEGALPASPPPDQRSLEAKSAKSPSAVKSNQSKALLKAKSSENKFAAKRKDAQGSTLQEDDES